MSETQTRSIAEDVVEVTQNGNFLRIGSWLLNLNYVIQIDLNSRIDAQLEDEPWVTMYCSSLVRQEGCPGSIGDWFNNEGDCQGQYIEFGGKTARLIRSHFGYTLPER
jgi:hypothetical protein